MTYNPVSYFEIPVTNMHRAMHFYKAIFGYELERGVIHGNDMAFFPSTQEGVGIT
jgi:uncharacterized protein